MTWQELAKSSYPTCIFSAPASVQQIEEVQAALSVIINDELKSLLLESNGIIDECKRGPVLSTSEIINLNLEFRRHLGDIYPAFHSRLFIANSAGGDLWCYKVNQDTSITDTKVYVWEHELAEEEPEEDNYFVQSDSLRDFLEWHLTHLSAL